MKTPKKSTKFIKGTSGNPLGRPKGSKNKTTEIKEAIEAGMVDKIQGDALEILNKTVELAKLGDTTCIKILMDRLWPLATKDKSKDGVDKTKVIINVVPLEPSEGRREGNVIEVVSPSPKAEKSS